MKNLRSLRKENKMSQQALADKLSVSRSTVAMWETGGSQPDNASLHAMADFFGVSVDFLLDREPLIKAPSKGVWINVLGDVAAGTPIEAIEDIVDQEEIPLDMAAQGEHFGLRIRGDSMEPKISDGDVVIVRRQTDVEDGNVAVVLVNGDSATVKRIRKRTDGILLIPFNQMYEPTFYSNAEIQSLPVVVLGKVVELRAKFE